MDTKTSEALARREAQELAAIPEWMRGDKEALALNIDFRSEDLTLPRLAICQTLTPQRKKSDPNYIDGLEEGDFFNTLSGENYGQAPIRFVVLTHWTENIYFDGSGGVKCRARNGSGCSLNGGRGCCHNAWDGDKKPECTEFLNFIAYLVDYRQIVVLSFKSTGLKVARQNLIAKLRVSQTGVADFAKIFEISAKAEKKGQNEWFVPVIRRPEMKVGDQKVGALVTDREVYDKLKESAQALRDRKTNVKVHDAGLDDEPDGEVRTAQVVDADKKVPF